MLFSVLASCASIDSSPISSSYTGQEEAETKVSGDTADAEVNKAPQMTCKYRSVTGSNRKEKVCFTR
jgi:hypothetical protein